MNEHYQCPAMDDDHACKRLAVIEEVVLRLEHRLFGNGQPGDLEKLQARVRRLESWFWRGAGAVSLAVLLLEHFGR